MYTYNLIDGGYEICHNNKLMLKQNKYPNRIDLGGMDANTAEKMAKLIISKLKNKMSPYISLEDEIKLSTEELSDIDLVRMIEG